MAVYVDAADALEDFDEDDLLSAVRSEVDAKVRQSMPTSIEAVDEEGPESAVRRVGADETAARSGRATAVRSKDMVVELVSCRDRKSVV